MCEALSGVKWFDLGIQLGLKHSRLRDIEIENPRDVSRCKIDMIAAWLKKKDDVAKKGGPTCKQLAEALRVIGEIGLSEEIGEIMKQKLSSPVVKSTKEKSRRDLSTDEKRSVKKRKKKMKKRRKSSDTDSDNEERGETHRYMYKKRKIESESDSSDNDDEKEEKSSKVKRKRIESRFDSHESKKSRLESSDDDERSVSSRVQGKGPASGKPYKRKRVPKNKTDSESEDDSDSEPSPKRR